MRFHPLVAAVVGLLALATVPALVKDTQHVSRAPGGTEHNRQISVQPHTSADLPDALDYEPRADLGPDNRDRNEEQGGPASPLWTNWIQALSGIAVALFTGFLLRLQSQQVGLHGSALDEAAKSAKAALETAGYAAQSAKAAVAQNRAWLKIENLAVSELRYEKGTANGRDYEHLCAETSIVITNVGDTPATHVVSHVRIWAFPFLRNYSDWWTMWTALSPNSRSASLPKIMAVLFFFRMIRKSVS